LLNARAVALNARRWVVSGTELIPGLITADAPRTDRVRLILAGPLPDLAERLADPRLGIVSPRAIRARANGTVQFVEEAAAGTGPFSVDERTDERLSLIRNTTWWGSGYRLGPALRQIGFVVEPVRVERLALLSAGQVEIADELGGRAARRELADAPLLTEIRAATSLMGVERSVRGIDASDPGTPLSGTWLTSIDQTPAG
jgi:MarR-like DNA-binding transcriptional regulator SgrR of sgrS sRNA